MARVERSSDASPAVLPGLPTGELVERPFYSALLGRDQPLLVFHPAGFGACGRRYPVLYLLHGLGADYRQWASLGIVGVANRLISEGTIPPLVIVMPNGESGYWMNHRPDGPRWRDYLINEVIPYVERIEPIVASRQGRAIGGISAGGHGALQLSWNNPGLFSVVGAHSPGLRAQPEALPFMGRGDDFTSRDPLALARSATSADIDIWIDTGDGDPWRRPADVLHNILVEKGIPHSWRHGPGSHDGAYWSAHLDEYLAFYGTALGRRQASGPVTEGVAEQLCGSLVR